MITPEEFINLKEGSLVYCIKSNDFYFLVKKDLENQKIELKEQYSIESTYADIVSFRKYFTITKDIR
jgi:hypothetical protein